MVNYELRRCFAPDLLSKQDCNDKENLGNVPEWDLSDLYSGLDDPAIEKDFDQIKKDISKFSSLWKGKIVIESNKPGAGDLAKAIIEYEKINDKLRQLSSYAFLMQVTDLANEQTNKFYADTEIRCKKLFKDLIFFSLELNKIEEDALKNAFKSNSALVKYAPWLRKERLYKPYNLEQKQEELFVDFYNSSQHSWITLFDKISASIRCKVGDKELTITEAAKICVDPDRAKRKAAYEAIHNAVEEKLPIFTHITNTLAEVKEVSDRWRGYKDIAIYRHLTNDIDPKVVETLVDVVSASNSRLAQRYFKLKAKLLGLDVLSSYDLHAPLPGNDPKVIKWSEARQIVTEAYSSFLPAFGKIVTDFFEKNWIDAKIGKNKSGGAFAAPCNSSKHPYILTNYVGKSMDVSTLAHELGHGIHQVLAAKQGELLSHTPLTLAETASVFGEMLTFRLLLSRCESDQQRRVLLIEKIGRMLGTCNTQIMYYKFERSLHSAFLSGGEQTSQAINELWRKHIVDYYGDSVDISSFSFNTWSRILHFIHVPFYVYAYAFGDCFVNALFQLYQEGHSNFKNEFVNLLEAGGTVQASIIAKRFGFNIEKEQFWQKGLSVIESYIDELEQLS